jgi:hypothetical protein
MENKKLSTDRKRPIIHATGVELVRPWQGFSVCGIYRFDLTDDPKPVTVTTV